MRNIHCAGNFCPNTVRETLPGRPKRREVRTTSSNSLVHAENTANYSQIQRGHPAVLGSPDPVIYILPQHRGHHTEPSSFPGFSAAPDTCKFPVENTATMKRTHTGLEADEYGQGDASDSAIRRSKVSRKIRACKLASSRMVQS